MIEIILFFAVIVAFIGFFYVGGHLIVTAFTRASQAPARNPKKQKNQAVKVQTVHPVYIAEEQNWKLLDTPNLQEEGYRSRQPYHHACQRRYYNKKCRCSSARIARMQEAPTRAN